MKLSFSQLHLKTVLLGCLLYASPLLAQQSTNWPLVLKNSQTGATIYQPQAESLKGDHLFSRAAISMTKSGSAEPVFGAIWFDAKLALDRNTREAGLKDICITNIRFPDEFANGEEMALKSFLLEELEKKEITMAYDKILASLESIKQEQSAGEGFNNAPPEIIVAEEPSILVYIDGDPVMQAVQGTKLSAVSNTPYFLVQDQSSNAYYLKGGQNWYSAAKLEGPWKSINKPPASVAELAKKAESEEDKAEGKKATDNKVVKNVFVRTSPAELIVSEGKPKFSPVTGTDLLYMDNSDSYVIKDIKSQSNYVLLSGRWYRSSSLKSGSNWTYVDAANLPADFAKIPEGSDLGPVLANVAGTNAASEAIMDAQIPQTAAVNRLTATASAEYDGNPSFDSVEGTSMQYALNSPQTILRDGAQYYMVDNGVWYLANSPNGPWRVSDYRPEQVDRIAPRSPVYNVRYVYIYDSTPEVVYVGYTPGYLGSYRYGPTIVYGTGWRYRPWRGQNYYSRFNTWGFHMIYNPYYGWNMGFGMGWGWFNHGYGYWGGRPSYGYGGWWGPPVYRPPYRPPYRPIYRPRPSGGNRPRPLPRPGNDPVYGGGRPGSGSRPGVQPSRPGSGSRPGVQPSRPAVQPPRPGTGGDRPAVQPPRPGTGGDRPAVQPPRPGTGGDRPAVQPPRPGTGGDRPAVSKPNPERPNTRPSPGIERPATRPSPEKPTERPATRPGNDRAPTKDRTGIMPIPNDKYADENGNVYQKDGQQGWQSRENNQWKSAESTNSTQPVSRPATQPTPTPPPPAARPVPKEVQKESIQRDRGAQRQADFNRSTNPPRASARPGGR